MSSLFDLAHDRTIEEFWDYKKQAIVRVQNPTNMSEETARRLIPQTPRAERLFIQYHKLQKHSPYRAIGMVHLAIFGD